MHLHVCVLHGTLDWTLWLCREADEISTPRVGQIREHLTRLDTTHLEAAIGTPTATPSDTLQHVFCKQISFVCAMPLSISMDISWHSQIRLMLHVTPLMREGEDEAAFNKRMAKNSYMRFSRSLASPLVHVYHTCLTGCMHATQTMVLHEHIFLHSSSPFMSCLGYSWLQTSILDIFWLDLGIKNNWPLG